MVNTRKKKVSDKNFLAYYTKRAYNDEMREAFCTTINRATQLDIDNRYHYAMDLLIDYLQVHYKLLQLVKTKETNDITTTLEVFNVLTAGRYRGELRIVTSKFLKSNVITFNFMKQAGIKNGKRRYSKPSKQSN